MISKKYEILAAQGLHARPATTLVKISRRFKSVLCIKKEDKEVKLNSILNILALSLKSGDVINLTIEGEDEKEAEVVIDNFFKNELKKL